MKYWIFLSFGENQDTEQVFNEITQAITNHLHAHPGCSTNTVLLVHENLKERLFSIWEEYYLRPSIPLEKNSWWQRFILWIARAALKRSVTIQPKVRIAAPINSSLLRKKMDERQAIPIRGCWFTIGIYSVETAATRYN